jgi:hypothetical protein
MKIAAFSTRKCCDERALTRLCDDPEMMTRQLEVSILAAPLAAIDRRALSQAWYSALRLAARGTPEVAHRPCAMHASGVPLHPHNSLAERAVHRNGTASAPQALGKPRQRGSVSEPEHHGERRAPRAQLAARIERVFTAAWQPKRATFSLGPGNARVHVMLQTSGTQVTLVALCSPRLRDLVGPELTRARRALAARGIGVEVRQYERGLRCF